MLNLYFIFTSLCPASSYPPSLLPVSSFKFLHFVHMRYFPDNVDMRQGLFRSSQVSVMWLQQAVFFCLLGAISPAHF